MAVARRRQMPKIRILAVTVELAVRLVVLKAAVVVPAVPKVPKAR